MMLGQRGCRLTAFDYSDGMLNQAKQNAASAGVTAEFVQGEPRSCLLKMKSFDMIVNEKSHMESGVSGKGIQGMAACTEKGRLYSELRRQLLSALL